MQCRAGFKKLVPPLGRGAICACGLLICQLSSLYRLDRSMNSVDFVEKEIEGNNVVVFSKSYCP